MTRPDASNADDRLETALKHVTDAIPSASPRQRAFLLKRAGDICVSVDQRGKALGWYGRAVDQSLELGDTEGAAQLCRLIIFVQPEAVRARCTLTWISIAAGDTAAAMKHLDEYVDAASRAGQSAIAARQLGWMFEATRNPQLRKHFISQAGNVGDAEFVAELTRSFREASPLPPLDREQLWTRVLDATIGAAARAART